MEQQNKWNFEKIQESATWIKAKTNCEAIIAIVLGSGLGNLANEMENPLIIPYHDIPNFPVSSAPGHKGNLIYGTLGAKKVLVMQGRFHYYEGYPMQQIAFPVRVFKLLGIKKLILSNAAGGINPTFRVGDLMVITDHINLMPNPLIGKNMEQLGPRFPDMTHVYDRKMIHLFEESAKELNISLQHGVYVGGTGPTYETRAEYNFFRIIGGDACGMSTTPEAIVARHASIDVFGVSVITNEAHHFITDFINDADEVLKEGNKAAVKLTKIVRKLVDKIG